MKLEEINKAIAEKVMGIKHLDHVCACEMMCHCGGKRFPSYATDISYAWQVVEKMREKGFKPKMWADGDDYVFAFFSSSFECKGMGQSLSPETAICLAALKAVS